jgi:hypothetical protein
VREREIWFLNEFYCIEEALEFPEVTFRGFRSLSEALGVFQRLQESFRGFRRLLKASGDFQKLQETFKAFRRLSKASGDFQTLQKFLKALQTVFTQNQQPLSPCHRKVMKRK